MNTKCYLKINSNGTVTVTKNRKYTDVGEVSLGLNIELPDVLFKRPQIEATIIVDAKDVQPFSIDADTSNMVKDAIESSTGFDVRLTVINPETEAA